MRNRPSDYLDQRYTPFNWPWTALLPYGKPASAAQIKSAASRLSLSKSVFKTIAWIVDHQGRPWFLIQSYTFSNIFHFAQSLIIEPALSWQLLLRQAKVYIHGQDRILSRPIQQCSERGIVSQSCTSGQLFCVITISADRHVKHKWASKDLSTVHLSGIFDSHS